MINYDDSFRIYRRIEDTINKFSNKYDLDLINNDLNFLLQARAVKHQLLAIIWNTSRRD